MVIFRYIVNWFLYGNLLIAICAMCFTLQAYYLLNIEPVFDLLIIMSGVSTLFTYLLIRVAAISRIKNYEPTPRWNFILQQMFWMRLLTIISAITTIIIYFLLPARVQLILLIPGAISLFYGISIKINGKTTKLRDLGIGKIFLISLVWAFAGSYMPSVYAGQLMSSFAVLILFIANFCFIFSVTLPFDIKDIAIDAMNNVKTIPTKLGVKTTYYLTWFLLLLSGLFHWYLQAVVLKSPNENTFAIAVSLLATAIVIYITQKKQNDSTFFGVLDGMIILQFILIFLFNI